MSNPNLDVGTGGGGACRGGGGSSQCSFSPSRGRRMSNPNMGKLLRGADRGQRCEERAEQKPAVLLRRVQPICRRELLCAELLCRGGGRRAGAAAAAAAAGRHAEPHEAALPLPTFHPQP
eukprot:scaffold3421_cov53-Phaeocystis_antarctica.AAC.3